MAMHATLKMNEIVIEGGNLKHGKVIMVSDYTQVNGRKFITLSVRGQDCYSRRLAEFVGNDFSMIDALMRARNDAYDNMVAQPQADDDPMANQLGGEAGAQVRGPKRARRASFGDVQCDILNIQVRTSDGGVHSVATLPHWHKRHNLLIELTEDNVNLLLKQPADAAGEEVATFKPNLSEFNNIYWNSSRASVFTRYADQGGRVRTKTKKVDFSGIEADWVAMQAACNEAAMALAEFRERVHHCNQADDDDAADVDIPEQCDEAAHAE